MLVSYQIGAQVFLPQKKEFNSEIEDLTVCRADLTEFEFKMLKVRLKISFLQNCQIFAYFSNKQVEKNKSFLSCCHLILDLTVIDKLLQIPNYTESGIIFLTMFLLLEVDLKILSNDSLTSFVKR